VTYTSPDPGEPATACGCQKTPFDTFVMLTYRNARIPLASSSSSSTVMEAT